MLKRIFTLSIAILLYAASLSSIGWAQSSLRLTVNPKSGTLSTTFLLGVAVNDVQSVRPPTIDNTDDFVVRYVGPQQSIQIINGNMQSSTTFFYRLTPKRAGKLTTPPVSLSVGADTLEADPITIDVQGSGALPNDEEGNDDIVLEQHLSSSTVYKGEQILDSLDLMTAVELQAQNLQDPPFDGFWSEEIKPYEQDQVVRRGTRYTNVRIKKALFPLKSGTLVIPQRIVSALARAKNSGFRSMDPFDPDFMSNFMNGGQQEVRLGTKPAEVVVKDLPPMPTNFPLWTSGDPIVGKTTISFNSPSQTIHPGDSKSIDVIVESYGNLNPLQEVPFATDDRWKLYQETPRTLKKLVDGKILFTKIFHCTLIPLSGGDLTVPSIRLGYFDPESKTYEVAETHSLSFHVDGPSIQSKPTPVLNQKQPAVEQPLQLNEDEQETESPSLLQRMKIIVLVIIGLFVALFFLWKPKNSTKAAPSTLLLNSHNVSSIGGLYSVFSEGIKIHLPKVRQSASIRTGLKEALLDSPLRFEIECLLDELEEKLYGDNKDLSEAQFEKLKASVYSLLSSWGLAK